MVRGVNPCEANVGVVCVCGVQCMQCKNCVRIEGGIHV